MWPDLPDLCTTFKWCLKACVHVYISYLLYVDRFCIGRECGKGEMCGWVSPSCTGLMFHGGKNMWSLYTEFCGMEELKEGTQLELRHQWSARNNFMLFLLFACDCQTYSLQICSCSRLNKYRSCDQYGRYTWLLNWLILPTFCWQPWKPLGSVRTFFSSCKHLTPRLVVTCECRTGLGCVTASSACRLLLTWKAQGIV